MQHGDDGASFGLPAMDQRQEVRGGALIDGGEGLVQQDGAGLLQGETREEDALELADGQAADGGFAEAGSNVTLSSNLWGKESLVTFDANHNCISLNCNPAGQEPIGYHKPSGVGW